MISAPTTRIATAVAASATLLVPFAASAATTLKELVNGPVTQLGNLVITLLYAFAFLFFLYGVFKYYFLKGTDPKSREEGKMFMIWGIIGLAVLFSVWSLVKLAVNLIPTA